MCVENKVPGMRKSKIVCYKMFQESQISILKAVHDKQPKLPIYLEKLFY